MARGEARPSATDRLRRDLRRHQRGALVLAAVGIIAALVMLPRGDELLLIHVRNHNLAEARRLLAEAARKGVSTAASVVSHGELYLLEGHVDEALFDLEQYLETRPDDIDAWRRLGRLYRHAQRLHDQMHALEQVHRLEPSESTGRELATFYRWTGDEVSEAAVLRQLVSMGVAEAEDHIRAAHLAAALGQKGAAADVLERLRQRDPDAFDYATAELYAHLLVDLGRPEWLTERVPTLPVIRDDQTTLPQLAATFRERGRPAGAVALFETPPGQTPRVEQTLARAAAAAGTSEAARVARDLAERDREQPLPAEAFDAMVDLALGVGDVELVREAVSAPGREVAPSVLASAIGRAVSEGRRDHAQAIVEAFGDGSLADSPMLALALAVERGDVRAAEGWIAALDAAGDRSADESVAIAQMERRLGRPEEAYDRLVEVVATGRAPAWALADFETLGHQLGKVDDSLARLWEAAQASGAAGPLGSWLRLAANARRHGVISAWLESTGTMPEVEAQALRDAYFALADGGARELGLRVLGRLYQREPTGDHAVLYGQALLDADRPVEALAPLRTAVEDRRSARLTYDYALYAAVQKGAPVQGELSRVFRARLGEADLTNAHRALIVEGLWHLGERGELFDEIVRLGADEVDRWLSHLVESARAAGRAAEAVHLVAASLDDAGLSDAQRMDRVRGLIELGAADDTLRPHLAELARSAGGTWVFAYDECLERLGRSAERIELWVRHGAPGAGTPEARRGAAFRLLDLGAKDAAVSIVQSLAARSGPMDADTRHLLYLWGPRPRADEIEWLRRRLEEAAPDDRPGWIDHLAQSGAPGVAIDVVPVTGLQASPALVRAWIDAHRALDDEARLRRAIERALDSPVLSSEAASFLGRTALAEGHTDLAESAFLLVLAMTPDDLEATRWAGTLAFYAGRTETARAWLGTYVERGGDDPEPLYQLGELAWQRDERARAVELFRRALARLVMVPSPDGRGVLRANLLARLGDRTEAIAAFDALLADEPGLAHVRADFASALLEWGDYDRARVVLQIP
jgi:tetratricopeptide (TPR) repeat protein